MRVMIDTNVLVSALLFPGQTIDSMMKKVTSEHNLVKSLYVIDELSEVTERKFPSKTGAVDTLLSQLPYELVYTPKQPAPDLFEIRDEKDYPILYSAIAEDVDVFITLANPRAAAFLIFLAAATGTWIISARFGDGRFYLSILDPEIHRTPFFYLPISMFKKTNCRSPECLR